MYFSSVGLASSPFSWLFPSKASSTTTGILLSSSASSSVKTLNTNKTLMKQQQYPYQSHPTKLDTALFEEQIEAFISSVFLDAQLEIAALGPDSSQHADCIREALSDLLPKCLVHSPFGVGQNEQPKVNKQNSIVAFTLSDGERCDYGIALSVCQFKATFMEYPVICNDATSTRNNNSKNNNKNNNKTKACLIRLHENPQWWTTFNGYYQSVGSLCLEQANNFQRDRILTVYQDLTSTQEILLRHVQAALTELTHQQAAASESTTMVTEVRHELELHMRAVQAELNNILQTVSVEAATQLGHELKVAVVEGLTDHVLEALAGIEVGLERVRERSVGEIEDVVLKLRTVLETEISEVREGVGLVLEDVGFRMEMVRASADDLVSSHGNLKDMQDKLGHLIEVSTVSYLFLSFSFFSLIFLTPELGPCRELTRALSQQFNGPGTKHYRANVQSFFNIDSRVLVSTIIDINQLFQTHVISSTC